MNWKYLEGTNLICPVQWYFYLWHLQQWLLHNWCSIDSWIIEMHRKKGGREGGLIELFNIFRTIIKLTASLVIANTTIIMKSLSSGKYDPPEPVPVWSSLAKGIISIQEIGDCIEGQSGGLIPCEPRNSHVTTSAHTSSHSEALDMFDAKCNTIKLGFMDVSRIIELCSLGTITIRNPCISRRENAW